MTLTVVYYYFSSFILTFVGYCKSRVPNPVPGNLPSSKVQPRSNTTESAHLDLQKLLIITDRCVRSGLDLNSPETGLSTLFGNKALDVLPGIMDFIGNFPDKMSVGGSRTAGIPSDLK